MSRTGLDEEDFHCAGWGDLLYSISTLETWALQIVEC